MIELVSTLSLVSLLSTVASTTTATVTPVRLSTPAPRVHLGPHLALFQDESNAIAVEAIAQKKQSAFVPQVGQPNLGQTSSTIWARFTVINDTAEKKTWHLGVEWPRLEEVRFYIERPDGFETGRSGWRVPFAERRISDPMHVMPIALSTGERARVFVQLRSNTEMVYPLVLYSPESFRKRDRGMTAFFALYFGILFTLGVYSLVFYIRLREPYHLFYAASVMSFALWWFFCSGFWGAFGSLVEVEMVVYASFAWMFFRLAFARSFLELSLFAPEIDRLLRIGMYVVPAALVASLIFPSPDFWDHTGTALHVIFVFATLVAGIIVWRRGQRRARWFVPAVTTILIGLLLGLITFAGVQLSPAVSGLAIHFGTVAELFVLAFALADSLRTVAAEKEQALRQIEVERLGSLQKLVAGVAHELNTPLGSLRSTSDSIDRAVTKLQESLPEDPTLSRVTKVLPTLSTANRQATDRIDLVVQSLRNFARLDESAEKEVDLHEGLDSVLVLLSKSIGEITIEKDYALSQPVLCRPGELNQVFMALLKNAIESMDGEGTIRLSTEKIDSQVEVRITDEGRGIPPDLLEVIFNPRLGATRGRVRMGLGLTTSKMIVQRHGGMLQLESAVGEGSCATIRLPLGLA